MIDYVPMTCASSKKVAPTPEQAIDALMAQKWFFELKLDGVRCIAIVRAGEVQLVNRRQADITGRYPEVVAALLAAYPTESIVFDGEIICYSDERKPDFTRIHKRDAQPPAKSAVNAKLAEQWPATYVAFDVLHHSGDDLRHVPYVGRRSLLRTLIGERFDKVDAVEQIVSDTDGRTMWAFCETHGLEGLIAKHRTAPYRPGRSSNWVKLKKVDTVSCVAVGYDLGEGSRSGGIGAVNLVLIEDGQPVNVGRVGTGFTDRDLADLKVRMDAGELLVMEIEYANWGATSRKLRFPAYKGLRTDVLPVDCTIDQLNPSLVLGDEAVKTVVSR